MTQVLFAEHVLPLGLKAKIQRVSRLLTQQELAAIAGVSQEDVDLLESNQPLRPDTRRKLLRALLQRRTRE